MHMNIMFYFLLRESIHPNLRGKRRRRPSKFMLPFFICSVSLLLLPFPFSFLILILLLFLLSFPNPFLFFFFFFCLSSLLFSLLTIFRLIYLLLSYIHICDIFSFSLSIIYSIYFL